MKKPKPSVTVKVRCVGCGATRDEGPNGDPNYMPTCDKCYSVMVPVSAKARR